MIADPLITRAVTRSIFLHRVPVRAILLRMQASRSPVYQPTKPARLPAVDPAEFRREVYPKPKNRLLKLVHVVSAPVQVNLVGIQATGTAAALTAANGATLTAAVGTGQVGTVALSTQQVINLGNLLPITTFVLTDENGNALLTESGQEILGQQTVSMTGQIAPVGFGLSVPLTAVVGTGTVAAPAVSLSVTATLVGVQGTGTIAAVSAASGVTVVLAAALGVGSIGTLGVQSGGAISISLSAVTGTGTIAALAVSAAQDVTLTATPATGSAASLGIQAAVILGSAVGTAAASAPAIGSAQVVTLASAPATGVVVAPQVSLEQDQSITLAALAATSQIATLGIGSVTILQSAPITGFAGLLAYESDVTIVLVALAGIGQAGSLAGAGVIIQPGPTGLTIV